MGGEVTDGARCPLQLVSDAAAGDWRNYVRNTVSDGANSSELLRPQRELRRAARSPVALDWTECSDANDRWPGEGAVLGTKQLRPQRELNDALPRRETANDVAPQGRKQGDRPTAPVEDIRPFRPSIERSAPDDTEIERAIVAAVAQGLADVARTLAAQLEERRRTRAARVLPFDGARARRGR